MLGDPTCELALKLARDSELLIYVQLLPQRDIEKARRIVDEAGFYGTRVFVEKGSLARIHLADNLADAAVVLIQIPNDVEDELLRVLRPGGKALLGPNKVIGKPFPEGVDDWSH
ncbi:MAG: class I SAM-dependent methyltransferase, partial [Planctomycetota bacterium]